MKDTYHDLTKALLPICPQVNPSKTQYISNHPPDKWTQLPWENKAGNDMLVLANLVDCTDTTDLDITRKEALNLDKIQATAPPSYSRKAHFKHRHRML